MITGSIFHTYALKKTKPPQEAHNGPLRGNSPFDVEICPAYLHYANVACLNKINILTSQKGLSLTSFRTRPQPTQKERVR